MSPGWDERVAEFHERLLAFYNDAAARAWLITRHPELGNMSPIRAIIRGRADEVDAIINRLESGAYR